VLLLSSCAYKVPTGKVWEGEAQFFIAGAYSKENELYLVGRENGSESKKQLVIRIDTNTGQVEALEAKWEKNRTKIYSRQNGFELVPQFQRPFAIDFKSLEETEGDLAKATDYEKIRYKEHLIRTIEGFDRWIILQMNPAEGTRKTRFTLFSRAPELNERYSQVYEIDLGTTKVRQYKNVVLIDPFGGFGMD